MLLCNTSLNVRRLDQNSMEIIKYPKRQDCHYKLTKGSSNESSINLSADIFELLLPDGIKRGESTTLTFKVYRDDYIKALCYIVNHFPLYETRSTGANQINYSYDFFASELYSITNFFTGPVANYTVTILYREDGRIYLKDLNNNGFNIRRFLVEDRTAMYFSHEEKPVIRIFLHDNPVEQKNLETPEGTVISKNTEPNDHPIEERLAVRDKVLKDFIYKVVLLVNEEDRLAAFLPYLREARSRNIQLLKEGSFRLTGMFISTNLGDIHKRNKHGFKPRWFETPFVIDGREMYLSTQWYGNGDYSLMYADFQNLILTCYGSNYRFAFDNMEGFQLWKKQ